MQTICKGVYAQDITRGYTNLVTHIQKNHPGWEDMMKVNDNNNKETTYSIGLAGLLKTIFHSIFVNVRIQKSSASWIRYL
jgi:hypothetical protein